MYKLTNIYTYIYIYIYIYICIHIYRAARRPIPWLPLDRRRGGLVARLHKAEDPAGLAEPGAPLPARRSWRYDMVCYAMIHIVT